MAADGKWTHRLLLLVIVICVGFHVADSIPRKDDGNSKNEESQKSQDSDDRDVLHDSEDSIASQMDTNANPVGSATSSPLEVQDNTVVLRVEINPKVNSAPKETDFDYEVFEELMECLCQDHSRQCIVKLAGRTARDVERVEDLSVSQSTDVYSTAYLCRKDNETNIVCSIMRRTAATEQCTRDRASCTESLQFFGSYCELGRASMIWDSSQSLNILFYHEILYSKLACYPQCVHPTTQGTSTTTGNFNTDPYGQNNRRDDDDDKDGDDSISPVIIGIIAAGGAVLLIIIIVFVVWIVRKKQKNKPPANNAPTGATSSYDGIDHGRMGGFQKRQSQGASRSNGQGRGRADGRPSDYTNFPGHSRNKSPTNNNSIRLVLDPTYDTIGDNTESTRAYYSVLDDAKKYSHPYHSFSQQQQQPQQLQQPQDPRNRPPMPLPHPPANAPVPYYSTADNSDVVSGQYIDLIGDSSQPAPLTNNEGYLLPSAPTNVPEQKPQENRPQDTATSDTITTATAVPSNAPQSPSKNNYFELERLDSTENPSVMTQMEVEFSPMRL